MRPFCSVAAALALAALTARAEGDAAPATPAPAPAAVTAPSAHLAAAQRLYQKLDLDAAMAELQQAELAAKDNEEETVQVLIYRGLIYSDTGKTAEANDQFKRALAIRPWAEVPPETSPRIAKMFSESRKSIWGMASVKPPQKKAPAVTPAAPVVVPPNADQTPAAQPALGPGK